MRNLTVYSNINMLLNGTERNGTERNGTERNGTERNGTERNSCALLRLAVARRLNPDAAFAMDNRRI